MLIIIVVFIVIVLVLGAVSYLLFPAPANVTITGVNFQSPTDNACGLNGAVDPTWYNTTVGSSIQLSYDITGANVTYNISGHAVNGTAACEISTLTTTTSGFSISGANVPLAVPANSTQILSFSVNPPGSAFTGVLTLVLT